ncbi:MAG: hypothetical protein EXR31_10425 [Betaproteobacteria bacterium]|nr:hypothetical protein [Betaproteobacteria bacterium]
MAPAELAQAFTAAVTRALTAGAAAAYARMLAGDSAVAPETIRECVLAAFGGFDPQINGRVVLTPRVRAAVGDALAVLAYNIGAAMAQREPA